jgi:hypothetical protein
MYFQCSDEQVVYNLGALSKEIIKNGSYQIKYKSAIYLE